MLKCLPSIAFNSLQYIRSSYFSIDFDQACGRLHSLIRACISDSLPMLLSPLNEIEKRKIVSFCIIGDIVTHIDKKLLSSH